MKKRLLALMLACSLPGQIQITEVMYNPAGTDSPNEFVELYNQSAAAVAVTGWIIADLAAQDLLYDSTLTGSAIIPAGGYGVIFEGDYDGQMYRDKVPVGTTVIYTGTTTIGNALGNTTDALFLIDSSGDTVASMSWATATPAGYSLEKIRLSRPDTDDNWTISRDSLGTPGAPNSVQPLACDGTLLVDSLHISDTIIKSGATVRVTVAVANSGRDTFSGSVIISKNKIPVATASVPELSELERAVVELLITPVGSGYHDYTIVLVVPADADTTNNGGRFELAVRYDPGIITINEFLSAPAADQREFVELVHLGDTVINLENWRVTDNNYGAACRFAAAVAAPGGYLVATVDSVLFPRTATGALYLVPVGGFPTLNNDGDQIRLLDPFDTVIDSLTYDERWNLVSGRSQEKILPELPSTDPANWQVCSHINGLTPGSVNSVAPLPLDGCILQDSVRHWPQFPEADEEVTVAATVANTGLTPFAANLLIHEAGMDLGGSETFLLAVGQSLNITVTISPLISGWHLLELLLDLPGDLDSSDNRAVDTLQVCYPFAALQINEFLAQPLENQTEFIELTGDLLIDLSDWGFSDNNRQVRRLPGIELQPGEYLVLAPDSLLFPLLPAGGLFIIPIDGWPALNNGGDAIFVFDPTGKIIDSLVYDESWPLQPGRSLEKLNPGDVSATSHNWSTAVNPTAMTPGAANSLYLQVRPEKNQVRYAPNPFSPDGDGHEDRLRISFQLQFELAIIKLELFDMRGRRIASPAWNRPVAQSGYIEWDGKRSDGERTRIGIYIARFSARDQTSGKTWEDVQTVVVAR